MISPRGALNLPAARFLQTKRFDPLPSPPHYGGGREVQDESASDAELKAWDRDFFPHKAKACGGEEEEWPWDESDT